MDFPPEIISKIFIHCLPWMSFSPQIGPDFFQSTQSLTVFDPCGAPFVLMHVCRRWRLIAEATPTLWTRLPLMWSTQTHELYKIYIKNSKQAPLWVRLHLAAGDAARKVTDILTPHSHRWEHLTIILQVHSDDPASTELSNLPKQLPLLRHLHLRHTCPSRRRETEVYCLPEFVAPLLRSVRVSSSDVLGFKLPWSQLTHYLGTFDGLENARTLLSLCTNLEVLRFHDPKQLSSMLVLGAPSSMIHLPRLRDLSLANKQAESNDYHSLLHHLVLPLLETVYIVISQDHSILDALCRCVARSSLDEVSQCLRSVEVQCSRIQSLNSLDLQRLSLLAPGIRELRVSRPSSKALSAMKFHPTNPFLFSNLQHLTLIDPRLNSRQLTDVIMSRCHPPRCDLHSCTRLRRVEVMFTEDLTLESIYMSRRRMIQPRHEAFQDVAECFTEDPSFQHMCEELESILTTDEVRPGSREYRLPSHSGESMDLLQCFLEFSDAVFVFLEHYEVHHPLLLSRHQAAPLLRKFLCDNLGSHASLLQACRPEFLDRAGALLDKWQPMIDEYSEKERWVVETVDQTYSLIRMAENCTHKVVYCTSG